MDESTAEDQALKQFLGTSSFGKQSREQNVQVQVDRSRRIPLAGTGKDEAKDGHSMKRLSAPHEPIHETTNAPGADTREDEDSEDDDDDDDDDEFPVSHEMLLKTHSRSVTSATIDPSGARLITGSTDCTLKFHDFASMTPTTIHAFKTLDPTATKGSSNTETHPVHRVVFNPVYPSQVLVVTALPQAKIFSRDGELQAEFVKGDMYLRDMHNTKGHVSEITTGTWNPTDGNICVTAGTDSTIRIWDVNNPRCQRNVIVYKSRAAGAAGRTRMTAVAWSSPAQGASSVLYAAALDGSLVMWDAQGSLSRPAAEIRDAHTPGSWMSGLDVSGDGRLVVTRGGDDVIKLWDTRKFKQPVNSVKHVSTSSQFPTTNIQFSPSSSNIITGSETGHLFILNPATLRPELTTPVTPGSPLITVLWHEKLNQIVTGSANAETHVLYNPDLSTGGAKLVMSKAPKRRHIDDDPNLTMDLTQGISGDSVILSGGDAAGATTAPRANARNANLGVTASGKSRDPRRPHMPAATPFAKSQPDEAHIRNNIPLSSMRDEDPREALLKYADKAKNDPMFTKAWSKTQPDAVFADLSDGDDGDGDGEEREKKRQRT